MSGAPIIQDPLGYIDSVIVPHLASGQTVASDFEIPSVFSRLVTEHVFPSIHIEPATQEMCGKLVHFCGLVQDMQDPEYYLGAAMSKTSGRLLVSKYRESFAEEIVESLQFDPSCCAERRVVSVIVPGSRSAYLYPLLKTNSSKFEYNSAKLMDCMNRRGWSGCSEDTEAVVEKGGKRAKPALSTASTAVDRLVVKLYHASDNPKLGDYVSVVGILSVDVDSPSLQSFVLHAVHMSTVTPTLHLPSPAEMGLSHDAPVIRKMLLDKLVRIFEGDDLAAEVYLLYLFTRVRARSGEAPVGKMTLHLSRVSLEIAHALKVFTEQVCPFVLNVSCDVDSLNRSSLVPLKDHDRNILLDSALMVPSSTRVLIDETRLEPGRLDEKGLRNLKGLRHVAQWQKVILDFSMFELENPVDAPVCILTKEPSTLLQREAVDVSLPLQTMAASPGFGQEWPIDQALACASWISQQRAQETSIDDAVPKEVEAWFLRHRTQKMDANGRSKVTEDDLHRVLVLSHLAALSFGNSVVSVEIFHRIMAIQDAIWARQGL
eukprot:ANDGO_06941.mRNA.1 hypothetical protein